MIPTSYMYKNAISMEPSWENAVISKYYRRGQENNIREALKTRRIVLLPGPCQCGKTTLAQKLSDRRLQLNWKKRQIFYDRHGSYDLPFKMESSKSSS